MYCPICFSDCLHIAPTGVALVVINNRQMDSSRILFTASPTDLDHQEMLQDISNKIDKFFKWYSNFQNKDDITTIELLTSEVKCENRCPIKASTKFSIVDSIITKSELFEIANKLAKKYHLVLDIPK